MIGIRSILAALAVAALATAAPAQEREPLRDFVTAQFYHGLPRDQAGAYGAEAVPELLAMLRDPEMQPHWHQIVDMLSIVGDERATDDLVTFFETRFEGTVLLDTFQALVQVPRALGEIARRGDPAAQAWLERGLMPEDWSERRVSWSTPTLRETDREVLFSKLNISGLGLVGNQSSLSKLRDLRQQIDKRATLMPALEPAVTEAISVNELIIERGPAVLQTPQFDNLIKERIQILRQ